MRGIKRLEKEDSAMNKKLAIVLAFLTSAAMLVWVLLPKSEKEPRQPIQMMEAASWEEKSLDTSLYESDAIVLGYFETALPSRWNTSDGNLPDDATFETVRDNSLYIYTEYIFQVEEFLKGDRPETSITIRTFGGQVGKDSMTMGSDISYELGRPYLLFLSYDPRLAQAENPGPFLMYDPATYNISNGKATSWMGEQDIEELKDYVRNSPLAGVTTNIPNTLEANKIMQTVKSAFGVELEAKNSSNITRYSDIFINDPRYPLNPESLELVRNVFQNPLLEMAGFLDYKKAYYETEIFNKPIYLLDPIWLRFVSIKVSDDIARVIVDVPPYTKEFTLVQIDGNWYVAGSWGITSYEDNSLPSALAPNIPSTRDVEEIIQTIATSYQDFILHLISIEVYEETATVYLHDGFRVLTISLVRMDGTWQITEVKGI